MKFLQFLTLGVCFFLSLFAADLAAQPFTNGSPEIDWEADFVCYTPPSSTVSVTLSRIRIFQAGGGSVVNSNQVSVRYYTADGSIQEVAPAGTLLNGSCGDDEGFGNGEAPPQYELIPFCDYLPSTSVGVTFFRIGVMQPGGVPFVVDTTAYTPTGGTYTTQGEQYDEPCWNLTASNNSSHGNVALGGSWLNDPSPSFLSWTATNTGLANGTVTTDDGTNQNSTTVPPGLTIGCKTYELGSRYRIYMCKAPSITNAGTTWNYANQFGGQ